MTQRYRYRAARRDGATVRGVIEAASGAQASAALAERGLFPLALEPGGADDPGRRPARRRDLAVAFRGIASLVEAGVPLERALGASLPLVHGPLRDALDGARQQIREGRTLAQALESSRGVVPAVAVGMIRAGERGSQLGAALEQVAHHLEQEAELVSRIRQALAYPLLLATAGTGSVLVIGTVVVPKFAELLGEAGMRLPTATRVLLAASTLLTRYGALLAIGVVLGVALLLAWSRRPSGALRLHRLLLDLPVIGRIRHALATARVSRALASMLAAGMPLLPALDGAREAAGDRAVADRLVRVRERVSQGEPLATSLARERALGASALQLFTVGESSGRVAAMAGRAGDLAAREAEGALKTLVSLLEPAMVVLFGGLVAFVAAALLQAVYAIRPGAA